MQSCHSRLLYDTSVVKKKQILVYQYYKVHRQNLITASNYEIRKVRSAVKKVFKIHNHEYNFAFPNPDEVFKLLMNESQTFNKI